MGSVGSVLVGSFVSGVWTTERARGKTILAIEPFETLARADRDDLAKEGELPVRFLAGPEGTTAVRFEGA